MIVNNKFKEGDIVRLAYDPDEEDQVVTGVNLIYSIVSRNGVSNRCTAENLIMVKKKCLHTRGYYPDPASSLSEYVKYKYCPDCGESLESKETN